MQLHVSLTGKRGSNLDSRPHQAPGDQDVRARTTRAGALDRGQVSVGLKGQRVWGYRLMPTLAPGRAAPH